MTDFPDHCVVSARQDPRKIKAAGLQLAALEEGQERS